MALVKARSTVVVPVSPVALALGVRHEPRAGRGIPTPSTARERRGRKRGEQAGGWNILSWNPDLIQSLIQSLP